MAFKNGSWLIAAGCLLLAGMATGTASARPVEPIKPKVIKSSQLRRDLIAHNERRLASDRDGLRKLAGRSGVARQRARLLADMRLRRRRIRQLKSGKSPWRRPLVTFTRGAIGRVYASQVVQVLSPTSARVIVSVLFRPASAGLPWVPGTPAAAYTDVKYKGVSYLAADRTIAMVGWNFSGLHDGEYFEQHGLVRVTKPLTYQAVGGQMTIPAIAPVKVVHDKKKPGH